MGNASAAEPFNASVDPAEIARFEAMAADWWDPTGKFRPLHVFNPARLTLIRDRICRHFGCETNSAAPLSGLSLLDIGCGGGLVSEPMARLGASVTAIDASAVNIGVAKAHAAQSGLNIAYAQGTAEALAAQGAAFDVVLTLEVVEHVVDVRAFIASSGALVKPGGLMIAATLNKTLKALALAKIGAEYVLGWLPRGTHDWTKFVTPAQLRDAMVAAGLKPEPPVGVTYNPIADRWRASADVGVNYMMAGTKPRAG